MEYLQYYGEREDEVIILSFKPYYKWNTFNTDTQYPEWIEEDGFKPYYKWNTFNTF